MYDWLFNLTTTHCLSIKSTTYVATIFGSYTIVVIIKPIYISLYSVVVSIGALLFMAHATVPDATLVHFSSPYCTFVKVGTTGWVLAK